MSTLYAFTNGSAPAASAAYAGNAAELSMLNGVPALLAGLTRPMFAGDRYGLSARIRRVLGLDHSIGSVAGRTFSTEYPLIMPTC